MLTRKILVSGFFLISAAVAQTPIDLPAYGNTFSSSLTRGFYFQCPVACLVTGLEVPNEQSLPNQVVEFIDFGASGPPAFPGTATGTQLFYDNATPSSTLIPTSIPLVAGNWYGVLGACNPSQGSATSANSYGTPGGPFVTTILGNPVTIARMGTQSGIASNGGNQPCWSEDAGPLGRVFVHIESPECFLMLGLNSINFPFGGDTFLVEPMLVLPMTLNTLPTFNVPNNNNLVGLPVYTQSVMYNPGVFPNDPIKVSQGLTFRIGQSTTQFGQTSGLVMWPIGTGVAQPGGQIAIDFSFL